MFHTIRIDPGDGAPVILRHVSGRAGAAEKMARRLGRLYAAKSVRVTAVTDRKLIARLAARISTLALLATLQLVMAIGATDMPMMRSARRPDRIVRPLTRRKDDA